MLTSDQCFLQCSDSLTMRLDRHSKLMLLLRWHRRWQSRVVISQWVSNRGGAFLNDGTATLTAVIYDRDANEVDPQGTDMNYRWWDYTGRSDWHLSGWWQKITCCRQRFSATMQPEYSFPRPEETS